MLLLHIDSPISQTSAFWCTAFHSSEPSLPFGPSSCLDMRVPRRTVPLEYENGEGEPAETVAAATTRFGIRSDFLIPGRGKPITNGAVVVEGATIEWVGDFSHRPSKYSAVEFQHVKVLMPGLWDCHVHFGGHGLAFSTLSDSSAFLPGAPTLAGAVTVADLRRTLEAGFTSVRELSGYAGYLWPGIRDGYLIGPNVFSSLTALSITGGHGDEHELPICAVKQFGEAGGSSYLCDGVDECIKAVRTMVRRGARCIKVCSSGGVLSLNDDPEDSQFSDDELKAIVDETERTGRAVAAHAIGKAGILAALRAGIKSIEHGCYLDEEVAALMKEKGAILVATRHIQESLLLDPSGFPEPIMRKIKKIVPLTRNNYDLAIEQGVKIALGTDTWNSNPEHRVAHGKNAMELTYAVKAGMTPLQAIEAMTATAPEVLGKQAPKSGQLKAGYDADLIGVAGNPLDDLAFLTNPDNVTHVWKGGKSYKAPA
ncbi:amidohydrolase [Apiospora arundinis]|uniref:Amidohydro-rel domain-containing protein n=1 Tax=Apiospora arundinis TaxID=335852 RepID=A0ABR2IT29_9PEZI